MWDLRVSGDEVWPPPAYLSGCEGPEDVLMCFWKYVRLSIQAYGESKS